MNIENHIYNAQKALGFTREKVAEKDYDIALAMLCNVMTETRDLISHVWSLKFESTKIEPASTEIPT